MRETSIERIQGDDYCIVYTGERKFVNQLIELQEKYPNEIQLKDYEDGFIGAKVPYDWFRFIKPPTKRKYTEEQRKTMSERMKKVREKKDENQQMANS